MDEAHGSGLKIGISDAGDHVRIEYRDSITMENQLRLVDLISGLHASKGAMKFLVDTRGCPIRYSIEERYEVAAYLAGKWKSELAVVFIIDPQHWTGLAENTAHNRGGTRVKVAVGEAEALDWLRSA